MSLEAMQLCPWGNHSENGITWPLGDQQTYKLVSMLMHSYTDGTPLFHQSVNYNIELCFQVF